MKKTLVLGLIYIYFFNTSMTINKKYKKRLVGLYQKIQNAKYKLYVMHFHDLSL